MPHQSFACPRLLRFLAPVCMLRCQVVNIPGNKWAEGETLMPYKGPAPGPDSGYHRYIFLLYWQKDGKMEFEGEERFVWHH